MLFLMIIFLPVPLMAQTKASGSIWLDVFGGQRGIVAYPQYSWEMGTPIGNVGGYGFIEVAPHEPLFTNHLVVYTPVKQFSVHTETGGLPRAGLSFFQVGPRLNVHETVPVLKKPLRRLLVAVLPHLSGIRPNNMLIAAATNRVKISEGVEMSAEGYRRFFPGRRPDYGEYWFLFHPRKTRPFSFGIFVLQHGGRTSFYAGIRISS